MNVAIVGSSLVYENEADKIQQLCSDILEYYKRYETIVISGGAKGVDTIALEVAAAKGFHVKRISPEKQTWEYFKKRNLQIVEQCNTLYCISTRVHFMKCYHHEIENPIQAHEKTAGCWTMNKAIEANKPTKFFVV